MSLHRSLKTTSGALNQHRNVLSRAERIGRLGEQGKFKLDEDSPLGLVKVISRKVGGKKKKAAEKETAEGAVAGVPGAEGAAAPAAGAKGAGAGAKGAAAPGKGAAAPAAKAAAPAKGGGKPAKGGKG